MREVILIFCLGFPVALTADDVKPKKKAVRVIAAWERLPGSGEFVATLVRGNDDRWHVRGEKAPFSGLVVHESLRRAVYETAYLKGLKHGRYTTWHRNGVISSMGIHKQGKRSRHREWDFEGGQIELALWNFDGTPKGKPKKD